MHGFIPEVLLWKQLLMTSHLYELYGWWFGGLHHYTGNVFA